MKLIYIIYIINRIYIYNIILYIYNHIYKHKFNEHLTSTWMAYFCNVEPSLACWHKRGSLQVFLSFCQELPWNLDINHGIILGYDNLWWSVIIYHNPWNNYYNSITVLIIWPIWNLLDHVGSDAANPLRMLQTRAVPRRLLVKPIPYIGSFMALDLPHCIHNI
jgi:hypothetical protein